MSVHYSGDLKLTADDFKTVHRGVEIGVKCIAWDHGIPVIGIVEHMPNGKYEVISLPFEFGDSPNTPEELTAAAGGTQAWIKNDLVPRINLLLALRFQPTGEPPKGGTIEDIDANLGAVLRWAPQPNGTLIVTAL